MEIHKVTQVFVPGGMPELTYVARTERKLEESLGAAKDNLCKLVTVTGMTKSGKTVLAQKVFPRDANNIWIDGGAIGNETDFWTFIVDATGGYTSSSYGKTRELGYHAGGFVQGELGLPGIAKGSAQAKVDHDRTFENSETRTRSLSPRAAAISQLHATRKPLIIDDFHYLNRRFQGTIIRALKQPIFDGIPVILIAIPHRRYDAVKVEREITGRIENIQIPAWEPEELLLISSEGFRLLNMNVSEAVCRRFALESYGSPHLMQEFCRNLAKLHQVNETLSKTLVVESVGDDLFEDVAEKTGKVIYDKLTKGPRQRTDRLQRRLKNGKTADIYGVTLLALAKLKPGLETIEYEPLRSSIREILAEDAPRAHEVTRVIEKMAEIAASDESSTPVLDWDKEERILHITDPFFAFYLKWGVRDKPL